jgi:lipopolysaccharide export system protein LptA
MIRILLALFLALSPVAANAAVHDYWLAGTWKGNQGGPITQSDQQGPSGNDPWISTTGNTVITSGPVEIGSNRDGAFFRIGTRNCRGCTITFLKNKKPFGEAVKVSRNGEKITSGKTDVKAGDKVTVRVSGIRDNKETDIAAFCLYYDGKQPRDIRQAPTKASTSNASMKVKAEARKSNKAKAQREQKRDRHEAKGGKGRK